MRDVNFVVRLTTVIKTEHGTRQHRATLPALNHPDAVSLANRINHWICPVHRHAEIMLLIGGFPLQLRRFRDEGKDEEFVTLEDDEFED